MRKLIGLLALALLCCSCSKQEDVAIDEKNKARMTTKEEVSLSVPIADITEDVIRDKEIKVVGDLIPEGVNEINVAFYGMQVTLTSENSIQKFINALKDVTLNEEYREEDRIRELETTTYGVELQNGEGRVIFVEDSEAIVVNKGKTSEKEYVYFTGAHTDELHYVEDAIMSICPECVIYIESSEYDSNRFYLMNYECEDYKVVNDVILAMTFQYSYDVASTFNFDGFELFEDDVKYDTLPNTSGDHFVILRRGDKEYYIYYYCE